MTQAPSQAKGKSPTEKAQRIGRIAEVLKALGHPTRMSLIEQLHRNEERSVQVLQEELKVEQSVLSHHLSKMRDIGLLQSRRDGQRVLYRLKDREIARIIECMENCDIF